MKCKKFHKTAIKTAVDFIFAHMKAIQYSYESVHFKKLIKIQKFLTERP